MEGSPKYSTTDGVRPGGPGSCSAWQSEGGRRDRRQALDGPFSEQAALAAPSGPGGGSVLRMVDREAMALEVAGGLRQGWEGGRGGRVAAGCWMLDAGCLPSVLSRWLV
jgi:hypothetical protein